jgi:hypothetical protein
MAAAYSVDEEAAVATVIITNSPLQLSPVYPPQCPPTLALVLALFMVLVLSLALGALALALALALVLVLALVLPLSLAQAPLLAPHVQAVSA